jgi:HAD superfamily hydrolase (TIGR01490 family)
MPRLAIFDLDQTLLDGDSDYLWGRFLVHHGLVDAAAYEAANQRFYEEYLAGTLDIYAFCRFSFAPLAANDLARLLALRARFVAEEIEPRVAIAAPALLERHRASGDTLIITTATNRFVTEPIARLLGVEHLIATDPEFVNGRYTGDVAGLPNFQRGKVERLHTWRTQHGQSFDRTICYSDSRNDLPLLEYVDEAVAVDPDDVLRGEAVRRGWAVISLRDPITKAT